MTCNFLLMTQSHPLSQQLQTLSQKETWAWQQVTKPTGLVVELEQRNFSGVWWDLASTNLDTTIATLTLIRQQVTGPIIVFTPTVTSRLLRKLYRAHADDVIAYPFDLSVVTPQIIHRLWQYHHPISDSQPVPAHHQTVTVTNIGDWQINYHDYTVIKNQQTIFLTPKEFQLLTYLVKHHGQVLSRDQLVSGVWGYDLLTSSRIVDIHISHLRDKLEDDAQHPQHLLTIRGFGYKLV